MFGKKKEKAFRLRSGMKVRLHEDFVMLPDENHMRALERAIREGKAELLSPRPSDSPGVLRADIYEMA